MLNPQDFLVEYNKKYSTAWQLADLFRADRGKGLPDWPEWCFLPLAGWYAITCDLLGQKALTLDISIMQELAALGAWRPSQDIYRFDTEIYAALASTPLDGDIPCSVLYRLPAWCVYVETPLLEHCGTTINGFFAHLEEDANSGAHELRLLIDMQNERFLAIPLPIGQWSIIESLHRVCSIAKENAPLGLFSPDEIDSFLRHADIIRVCLNLLLYLCTDKPDASGPIGVSYVRGYPRPKKTKNGWRLFPPPKPTIWHMGENVGRAIRQAKNAPQGGTHASPRPHIRRAHWHGFWSGPRQGERRFDMQWLPPIPVAMSDEPEPM